MAAGPRRAKQWSVHMSRRGFRCGPSGRVSRRDVLWLCGGALALPCLPRVIASARAAEKGETHGISAFGDLKYHAGFRHFDYVDPAAPKGGVFSQVGANRFFNQNFLTFNSLNSYILKGD